MRRIVLITAFLGAFGAALWVFVLAPSSLTIVKAVASPVPGAPHNVMVTFTIENPGGPDRLLEVTSGIGKLAVLKAPDTVGLPVPARSSPSLSMEAGHVMLMGLPEPPSDGAKVPMALHFERAGQIRVEAVVTSEAMDHGLAYDVPAGETPPFVAITVTPDGGGWIVRIATESFTFARDLLDGPHQPGTGHAHLFVQGIKIGRVFEDTARIETLPPGKHLVQVTLMTNDHRAYRVKDQPIEATARINVK